MEQQYPTEKNEDIATPTEFGKANNKLKSLPIIIVLAVLTFIGFSFGIYELFCNIAKISEIQNLKEQLITAGDNITKQEKDGKDTEDSDSPHRFGNYLYKNNNENNTVDFYSAKEGDFSNCATGQTGECIEIVNTSLNTKAGSYKCGGTCNIIAYNGTPAGLSSLVGDLAVIEDIKIDKANQRTYSVVVYDVKKGEIIENSNRDLYLQRSSDGAGQSNVSIYSRLKTINY